MNTIMRRYSGIVREFDKTRGLGTIETENGEQVFVRYSAILGDGLRALCIGERVSFDMEQSRRGPSAVRVMRQ